MRTLIVALVLSTTAHAGLSFHYTRSSSHSRLSIDIHLGAYGAAFVPAAYRAYGPVIHARWPTPGNRFYATTDDVWFYNPYDPPSYRTFGLVRLDADGNVVGVSEYPKSGRGFDFDLTILQREAALREAGLGVRQAQEEKARSRAIRVGLDALRSRNYAAAQAALKDAVWIDPEDGPAQMLYGMALLAAGDARPAAKAIRRGLEAMPEFRREWARLADLVPDGAERDRIAADIDRRLKDDPENANDRFLAGWVRFSAGNGEAAAETWGKLPDDDFRRRLLDLARK